jgi:Skp family chaperone for outer membrane proteins
MQAGWTRITLVAAVAIGATLVTWESLRGQAASAPETQIAVVDIVQVFNQYQKQRDLTREMQELEQQIQAENTARREAIETEQTKIGQLNPEDPGYRAQRSNLMRQQIEYRSWTEMVQAQMQREVALWSERVYQDIVAATRQVAEERGYEVVLYVDEYVSAIENPDAIREQIRSRKVIYASDRIDLTQSILERVNQDYAAAPQGKMMSLPLMEP